MSCTTHQCRCSFRNLAAASDVDVLCIGDTRYGLFVITTFHEFGMLFVFFKMRSRVRFNLICRSLFFLIQ